MCRTFLASELCLQSRVPFLVGQRAGCELIAVINRTRALLTRVAASVLHFFNTLQLIDGAVHPHQLLAAKQRNPSCYELYILVLFPVASVTKPVIGPAAAPCAANVVTIIALRAQRCVIAPGHVVCGIAALTCTRTMSRNYCNNVAASDELYISPPLLGLLSFRPFCFSSLG